MRTHVISCWFALLLVRIAETTRRHNLGQDRGR